MSEVKKAVAFLPKLSDCSSWLIQLFKLNNCDLLIVDSRSALEDLIGDSASFLKFEALLININFLDGNDRFGFEVARLARLTNPKLVLGFVSGGGPVGYELLIDGFSKMAPARFVWADMNHMRSFVQTVGS